MVWGRYHSTAGMSSLGQPENFRLEVEDASATGGSVSVTLKVGTRSTTYTLDKKSGNKFRGEFLRLVTDNSTTGDDTVQGTQTVLCKLGEQVVLSYTRAGATCTDKRTIGIGRPLSENDNGTDQLKHDIRELKVNVVVFSKPGTTKLDGAIDGTVTKIKVDSVANAHSSGTIKIENEVIPYTGTNATTNEFTDCTRGAGKAPHADNTVVLYSTKTPAVTRTQVDADLDTVDERFAQSTIRLKRPMPIDLGGTGDPGKVLPGAMLDGFTTTWPLNTPNADETAIATHKDTDANSIDVFYINSIDTSGSRGYAYMTKYNGTGNSAGCHW